MTTRARKATTITQPVAPGTPHPNAFPRLQIKSRLAVTEEKQKAADAKKKQLLDSKSAHIREQREKRLEMLRKNQIVIKKQLEESKAPKVSADQTTNQAPTNFPVGPSFSVSPSTAPKARSGTFSVAKKFVASEIASYQLTPPAKEPLVDAKDDLAAYLDSDNDEPGQGESKTIPAWAQGEAFRELLKAQFSLTKVQMDSKVASIFGSGPKVPVSLEEMGFPVRDKYETRATVAKLKKAQERQASVTSQMLAK